MSQWIKLLTAAALWTVVLMFAGCAGITPYDPPEHGEQPPSRGLFSGADGEFVIYRKADEPENGSEAGKRSDETADGEQQ